MARWPTARITRANQTSLRQHAQYLGVVEAPDERRPETPCQRAAPPWAAEGARLTLASRLLLLSMREELHMTWFRRRYGIADYGRAFEEFEALFNRLHGPREMMMIKTELGDGTRVYLSLPDPKLKWNEDRQSYDFGEIDWDEFWRVVNGDGPCNRERLAGRVKAWDDGAWVREAALVHAARRATPEALAA